MIKLKNLIDGTVRNPFTGELYEGLIYSVEIDKAISILDRAGFYTIKGNNSFIVKIECWYKEKLDNEIYFASAIFEEKFSKLYKLANNLGYYIAKIKTAFINESFEDAKNHSVKSESDIRNIIKKYNPHVIYFMFEKKYDDMIDYNNVPKLLYHVTSFDKVESIKRIGFKPVSRSKRGYHPERIYLALTKVYADEIWSNLKGWHINKDNGVLITIDRDKLQKDTNFYIDPNFLNKGIYTYNNISKNAIVSIEKY